MSDTVTIPAMQPARDVKEIRSDRYPPQVVFRPEDSLVLYQYGVLVIAEDDGEFGRFHSMGFGEKGKAQSEEHQKENPKRYLACRRLVMPVERIPSV